MASKDQTKELIFVCSPYRPTSKNVVEAHRQFEYNFSVTTAACREIALAGNIPYAPHLFAPSFLKDKDPKERQIGINIGLEMLKKCDYMLVIVSKPYKLSEGMKQEIEFAKKNNIKIIYKCANKTDETIKIEKIKEDDVK